ncbi:hydrophobic surface binding protein A-domain-containing protein [Aspergillus heterothallicus]
MKFSGLFTLAMATAAIATPAKRQTSPADIIASIADQVTSLGTAIDGYSGGDTSSIKSASDDLVDSINAAVETVNNGDDLSNSDALALTGPVQDLIDQVTGVIDTLNSKSDLVVEAGETTSSSTESATETSTGTEEPTSTATSSTPVIPTTTGETTPTATPTSSPTDDTPAPEFTGAASKQGFSLVGGALAAVAVAVAI